MKALVVFAHPEPKSFNAAMKNEAVRTLTGRGFEVRVSDLYEQRFNPVAGPWDFRSVQKPEFFRLQGEQSYASQHGNFAADVARELEDLIWCELLILQFPTWWFGAPAILKGWVDRVMAAGTVYDGWAGKLYDQGGLKGRKALISTTVGGVESMYRSDGLNGVTMAECHRALLFGVLYFTGFDVLSPQVVYAPARLDEAARTAALHAYRARLLSIEQDTPLKFPKLADFDENFLRKSTAPE